MKMEIKTKFSPTTLNLVVTICVFILSVMAFSITLGIICFITPLVFSQLLMGYIIGTSASYALFKKEIFGIYITPNTQMENTNGNN